MEILPPIDPARVAEAWAYGRGHGVYALDNAYACRGVAADRINAPSEVSKVICKENSSRLLKLFHDRQKTIYANSISKKKGRLLRALRTTTVSVYEKLGNKKISVRKPLDVLVGAEIS